MNTLLSNMLKLSKEGIISELEVGFAETLIRLYPDISDRVLIAAVICVHYQQQGNICVVTDKITDDERLEPLISLLPGGRIEYSELLRDLQAADCVGDPGEFKPLILEENRLYLQKYHKYENELVNWLAARTAHENNEITAEASTVIESLFGAESGTETDWQKAAVYLSVMKDFLIISGGPGTGKTYTVKKIIDCDRQLYPSKRRIALAAPTGKAARRLTESLQQDGMDEFAAQTIHRLLGVRLDGTFKYGKQRKLPFDVVIIDEASMLDIRMWIQLIRSLHDSTKLIILGDKDQLSSVEAGAVLGDICYGAENTFSENSAVCLKKYGVLKETTAGSDNPVNDSIVLLTKSHRFGADSGLKQLSEAVNAGNAAEVLGILNSNEYPDVQWITPQEGLLNSIIHDYRVKPYLENRPQIPKERFSKYAEAQILCAVRKGPYGVEKINRDTENFIKDEIGLPRHREWLDGRLIMFTRNDPALQVQNGETGIYFTDEHGVNKILVEGDTGRTVSAANLKEYEPGWAVTVHKSQGSEYNRVILILPDVKNAILSKEFLYTGVTRARFSCLVVSSKEILTSAVSTKIVRNSGLSKKIWKV